MPHEQVDSVYEVLVRDDLGTTIPNDDERDIRHIMNRVTVLGIVTILLASRLATSAADQNEPPSDLAKAFRSPPPSARPHAFWYWMEGHVTREGIDADLEAMRRVGIGGVELYTIGGHAPPGPLKTLGPEWWALLRHAIRRAGELGLEVDLNNSPASWSSTNGPWITPELAMQKVTWSETRVPGGKTFSGMLPPAPDSQGLLSRHRGAGFSDP